MEEVERETIRFEMQEVLKEAECNGAEFVVEITTLFQYMNVRMIDDSGNLLYLKTVEGFRENYLSFMRSMLHEMRKMLEQYVDAKKQGL